MNSPFWGLKAIKLGLLLVLCCMAANLYAETAPEQGSKDKSAVDFTYSPAGKRDPFTPLINSLRKTATPKYIPKTELEKYQLDQFRLIAVLVVQGKPRAMVKAPDGKSYLVVKGKKIGRFGGEVVDIQTKVVEVDKSGLRREVSPDRIVVEEVSVDNYTGKQVKNYRYITM